MRTIIRILACGMALFVPARGFSQTANPPPAKGGVLLLKNERLIEGDSEKIGEQYHIVRPSGGETWLPSDKALRLCTSRGDAYLYLRTQTNLGDPDERLRLARWCLLYELSTQALAELRAADELRPNHTETRRLLAHVERVTQIAGTPPTPPPVPAPTPTPSADTKSAKAPASGLELNTECMGLFAHRVQPI